MTLYVEQKRLSEACHDLLRLVAARLATASRQPIVPILLMTLALLAAVAAVVLESWTWLFVQVSMQLLALALMVRSDA